MKNIKNQGLKAVQKNLALAEIRNDCLIMKDGSLRAVLLVSSINFALKSQDEQQAIISAYMQFLNSFDFPIQIIIQSRRLNLEKYLNSLKQAEKEQVNELLQLQIADYRNYVSELIKVGDIMTKKFYLVVPYNPLSDRQRSFWARLKDLFTPGLLIKLSEEKFDKRKQELWQRVSHLQGRLGGIGLRAEIIETENLIELFYNSYNPDLAETEPVAEQEKLQLS
ncbi:MAG: hypothetical protein WCT37_03735 [Patescibacteria group bacterium]|jgi:hypothetical protein